MALDVTVGGAGSDSYATVAEADAYLAVRPGFDVTAWSELDEGDKELRLQLATQVLDTKLKFRGVRACKTQALAWPRLFPGDPLYAETDAAGGLGQVWADWTTLEDYAELVAVDTPEVPTGVKKAQIEIAFQVVHSHLLTLQPFADGAVSVASIDLDAISVTLKQEERNPAKPFSKADFDAMSIVRLYLGRWLTGSRMSLI